VQQQQPVAQQTTQPVPYMDTDPAAQQQPPPAAAAVQPAAQQPIPATAGTMPTLYLIFNGQKIPITKEQFIIGRGLKTSDLAIKDGNISRKHAAIIYHNGAYYIKDLGSVNGIEYGGKRIDSKRIDENDQFHICDYELRFTYT
jgi:pSer/pThr/pTyr-binding forkhead associated (FHA) protein